MTPQVRLIETGPSPEQTREITVTKSEFLIGRGHDCDLRLPVSEVSRHHCIIRVGADEVSIIDLGSSNGTFVNRQRVRSQAVLHGGDQLQIGTCQLVVSLEGVDELEAKVNRGADPMAQTFRVSELPPSKEAEGKK